MLHSLRCQSPNRVFEQCPDFRPPLVVREVANHRPVIPFPYGDSVIVIEGQESWTVTGLDARSLQQRWSFNAIPELTGRICKPAYTTVMVSHRTRDGVALTVRMGFNSEFVVTDVIDIATGARLRRLADRFFWETLTQVGDLLVGIETKWEYGLREDVVDTWRGSYDRLVCLDAESGRQLWHHPNDNPVPCYTPDVAANAEVVLVPEKRESSIVCFELRSGKELWRHQEFPEFLPGGMRAENPGLPSILQDMALLRYPNKVVALDLRSGKLRWKSDEFNGWQQSAWTVCDGCIFQVQQDHYIVLDAFTGKTLFVKEITKDLADWKIRKYIVYCEDLAVTKDFVFMPYNGMLVAFDRFRGDIVWKHKLVNHMANGVLWIGGRLWIVGNWITVFEEKKPRSEPGTPKKPRPRKRSAAPTDALPLTLSSMPEIESGAGVAQSVSGPGSAHFSPFGQVLRIAFPAATPGSALVLTRQGLLDVPIHPSRPARYLWTGAAKAGSEERFVLDPRLCAFITGGDDEYFLTVVEPASGFSRSYELDAPRMPWSLSLSPGSQCLLTTDGQAWWMYLSATRKLKRIGLPGSLRLIDWLSDAELLIARWEPADGFSTLFHRGTFQRKIAQSGRLGGMPAIPLSLVAYSQGGLFAAAGVFEDTVARLAVFDLEGRLLKAGAGIPEEETPVALQFGPRGLLIGTARDDSSQPRIWLLDTGGPGAFEDARPVAEGWNPVWVGERHIAFVESGTRDVWILDLDDASDCRSLLDGRAGGHQPGP